jgi:hypothetical protein
LPLAMDSILEFVVQFQSLRNVDLFRQGLYHITARLYTLKDGSDAKAPNKLAL